MRGGRFRSRKKPIHQIIPNREILLVITFVQWSLGHQLRKCLLLESSMVLFKFDVVDYGPADQEQNVASREKLINGKSGSPLAFREGLSQREPTGVRVYRCDFWPLIIVLEPMS